MVNANDIADLMKVSKATAYKIIRQLNAGLKESGCRTIQGRVSREYFESARLLFQVVSACYERRSMIFTTNIEFSKWGTILGDDKLAAAMIDRIVHHGRLIEFGGSSHRVDAALMLGKANV